MPRKKRSARPPRAPALRNAGTNTRASTRNKNAETARSLSSSPPPAANPSDEKVKKAPARLVLGKTKPVSELSPTETWFFNYAGTCVPNFLFYIAWERAVLTICCATDPHENSINGNTFQAWMDDLGVNGDGIFMYFILYKCNAQTQLSISKDEFVQTMNSLGYATPHTPPPPPGGRH
jgi:hypothetical protein